jgi:hypothetical protein
MDGGKRQLRALSGGLILILWVGLMIFGLWPFNFWPRNRVVWMRNPARVYFENFGEMYSAAPWTPPSSATGSFTLELSLKSEPGFSTLSPILSWLGPSQNNFDVAQSYADLLIEGRFRDRRSGEIRPGHFYLDKALGNGRRRFLTITSGVEGLAIYLDGAPAQNHPEVSLAADSFSGELLLGHTPDGNQPWAGEVYGMAFYERTLSPAEVAAHYQEWTEGRSREAVKGESDAALYLFDSPAAETVHDLGGRKPDLIVPQRFRLQRPTVLEFPGEINRYEIPDIVVNILGFIPFGFLVAAYVRLGGNCRRGKAFAIAVLAGALTSLAIELLQVYLPPRDSSALDLINNILGSGLGAVMGRWVKIPSWRGTNSGH